MAKIYELTRSYRIGRRYVNPAFRCFYSKFIVLGKENIPLKGPVIFAPNHYNALMDALVVLSSTSYKLSNTFIARSDVFKKGFFSKALRFLKILPAFRIRDGYGSLGKNDDTFEQAREVLEKRNALCIMPEGSQGDQLKLRPFAKGIFRIAFTAQEQIGTEESVDIVPLGIDYSDRVRFGEEVVAYYGPHLHVIDYMPLYKENPAVAINRLRDDLKEALHKQMVDLATEEHYEAFKTALYATDRELAREKHGRVDPASRFLVRCQTAESLVAFKASSPDRAAQLAELCDNYRRLRDRFALSEEVLGRPLGVLPMLCQLPLLLLTLPVFVCGLVLNMFPFFLPVFIRKKMGVKYDGFFSSFDFVLGGILLFPIFYLLQSVLYAVFSPFPWWTVVLFLPAQYLLGKWAFRWYKAVRLWCKRLRFKVLKMTRRNDICRLMQLRNDILKGVSAAL